MIEKNEIPHSWTSTNLGSVCKLRNGFAFKSDRYTKEGIPVIRISDIGDGKVDLDYCVKVELENHYLDYKVRKGDILVAMSGATTGKFGIYKSDQVAFQNQRVGRFEILDGSLLNNQFLLFLLYGLKHKILEDAYGGAQPNISSGKIEEMVIPLPPIAEQERIVLKIEELLRELDKGIETLTTAQKQLKVYRQAVLKYAFEGKFTNPNAKEGELPEGWTKKTFQDVSTKIGDIDHKMPLKVDDGVFPYLSTGDITDENKLDFNNCKLISKEDFLRLSKKIKPQKGDIIFPRYGTIGRNVLVQTDIEFLISYSCAIIKPNPAKIDSNYFYHYTLSSLTDKEIKKYIVQTTQANVGISSIKSFLITFPESISHQKKIVQEIESRLSVCSKIEQSIQEGLHQAETLRQSILKKAFEGKLVPQDPNDEPACVLSERINAERQKVQPEKKTKTKKVKA